MLMRYLYVQTGLNHFHSTDLDDMRRALLDEDQDGPDGGSADITAREILSRRRMPASMVRPRMRPRIRQ